jgi:hypothetical protein
MPAVNYQMMYDASVRAGGPGDNQIVYWPGLLDWKNQTLTPNPDVIYVMPFFNTKDVGPVVLEVPPAGDERALNGSIMNYWQVAIEDIGPAGVDEGRGGKCVILPPDYDAEPPEGYIQLRWDTYQGYGLIRSNPPRRQRRRDRPSRRLRPQDQVVSAFAGGQPARYGLG